MPVRRIGTTGWGLTGLLSTEKADDEQPAFESSLERDLYVLLKFDVNVARFDVQPCEVPYRAPDGRNDAYVPDVFVEYRRDFEPARSTPHGLYEVKYREDLWKHWKTYRPRFRAAVHYARERAWRFHILTEVEIRTTYLVNAKFLLRYRDCKRDERWEALLLERVSLLRETDPQTLVASFFSDPWKQAEILPQVWRLLANRKLGTNYNEPLTMVSRIWNTDPTS